MGSLVPALGVQRRKTMAEQDAVTKQFHKKGPRFPFMALHKFPATAAGGTC